MSVSLFVCLFGNKVYRRTATATVQLYTCTCMYSHSRLSNQISYSSPVCLFVCLSVCLFVCFTPLFQHYSDGHLASGQDLIWSGSAPGGRSSKRRGDQGESDSAERPVDHPSVTTGGVCFNCGRAGGVNRGVWASAEGV